MAHSLQPLFDALKPLAFWSKEEPKVEGPIRLLGMRFNSLHHARCEFVMAIGRHPTDEEEELLKRRVKPSGWGAYVTRDFQSRDEYEAFIQILDELSVSYSADKIIKWGEVMGIVVEYFRDPRVFNANQDGFEGGAQ